MGGQDDVGGVEGGHCHAHGSGGKECGANHQGNRDFILCRNGICCFVSREDIENLPEAQSGKQILEDTFNIKIRDKEEPITEKTIVPLKLEAKPIESKTVYESPMIVSSPKLQERGPVEVSVI